MNINKIDIDKLNAQLKIQISTEDYQENVDNVLKDYRKKASVPGFRPGKVPMGMVKKMYGKAVLVEEVNKVLQNAVYSFITEEKLDILGNPVPQDSDVDWDNPGEMEFTFDMGLSPEFDLKFTAKDKLTSYKVVADDSMVDDYLMDIRRRYGKLTTQEESTEEDSLVADFTQLLKKGEEGDPIQANGTLMIPNIKDKRSAKKFIGVKSGDVVKMNPSKIFDNASEVASLLQINKEQAEQLDGDFEMEVKTVQRLIPAELDQELFDKVYGEGTVNSEDELRDKVKEDLENMFVQDSERKFLNDATQYVLDKIKIELPDVFLKRWLQTQSEELTEERVDLEYEQYAKGTKWQLIENRIARDHGINVERDEVKDRAKQIVAGQMAQYGQQVEEEELNNIAERVLANEEEAKRVSDQIFEEKLKSYFKETFKIQEKEVTYDEFLKLATK
jgi:trigger factor